MKNKIANFSPSFYPNRSPFLYVKRENTGLKLYVGKTPLRCARFLNMTLAMAARYEQAVMPKSATPDSPA